MIWLLHKLGILRGVYLQDYVGEIYRTYVRNTPFGPIAFVYPWTRIGHVVLKDDGTCGGSSSYIDNWRPM